MRATSTETPAATALAGARHRRDGGERLSAVDPRTVAALPVPEDVRLVPFGELADPRPLYELDLEVSA